MNNYGFILDIKNDYHMIFVFKLHFLPGTLKIKENNAHRKNWREKNKISCRDTITIYNGRISKLCSEWKLCRWKTIRDVLNRKLIWFCLQYEVNIFWWGLTLSVQRNLKTKKTIKKKYIKTCKDNIAEKLCYDSYYKEHHRSQAILIMWQKFIHCVPYNFFRLWSPLRKLKDYVIILLQK